MSSISSINSYTSYVNSTTTAAASSSAKSSEEASSASSSASSTGVVYEKSSSTSSSTSTSKADNSAIVAYLKADEEKRTQQLMSMVMNTMRQQGAAIGNADSVWSFLASGNYTVSEAAKAQAQAAVADDGYWGVDQTSTRIVEFAKALAGGDTAYADTLLAAFEKGFQEATGAWGSTLPTISQQTYDAVHEKFAAWVNGTE